MKDTGTKVIRVILYVVAAIFAIMLIGFTIAAFREYNEGLNGYSYSYSDPKDYEYDLEHGNYDWVLRELKNYKDVLFTDETGAYDEVRAVAEYYQFSTLSRAYFYTGDKEMAGLYASKAAEASTGMGKFDNYRSDIDNTVSIIGD